MIIFWDDKSLEKEVEAAYDKGKLTFNAEIEITKLHKEVCETLKFDLKGKIKEIKQACLDKMLQNWKGYYNVKTSIRAYFTDLCKQKYNSLYRKYTREQNFPQP